MSLEWWPHEGQPYYLIDAPEDGYIEERCWVPVRAIESDAYGEVRATGGLLAAALAFIESSMPGVELFDEADAALVLTGERVWERPIGVPEADGTWRVRDGDDPPYPSDYCPWTACAPDDPNAVEFYVLELADRERTP